MSAIRNCGRWLGIAIILLMAGFFVNVSRIGWKTPQREQRPTITPTARFAPTPTLNAKLSPPINGEYFPTQQVPYPPDWPNDLRYPDEFILVETVVSPTFADGTRMWDAKLRYKGDLKTADRLLSQFLTAKGWQIIDHIESLKRGITVMIERNNQLNSGGLLLNSDTEHPDDVIILVTIRC